MWRMLTCKGQFEIKEEEVLEVLKSIEMNKCRGPDGIHPRLLGQAGEEEKCSIFSSHRWGPGRLESS